MNIENVQTKNDLSLRLKRLEGQMRGIADMVEQNRDCREVMQQISAARAALQATAIAFAEDYMQECMRERADLSAEENKILVDDMINLLKKV